MGKPAELWCNEMYEAYGVYSYLPVDKIMCRCAYGNITFNDDRLELIVPLVE